MKNTLLHRISRYVNTIFYGYALAKCARTAGVCCMKAGGICGGNGGRWGRRLRTWRSVCAILLWGAPCPSRL